MIAEPFLSQQMGRGYHKRGISLLWSNPFVIIGATMTVAGPATSFGEITTQGRAFLISRPLEGLS